VAQEGFAQLEVAVPSWPVGHAGTRQEGADEPGHHRDGPAQALSHDRGHDRRWGRAGRALLARVRPRDLAGQARRRVAADLIAGLERIHQRKKAADKGLTAAVKATGTTLMTLDGIGPSGAARLLVEAGDITRFPDRGRFASWNGTAPIGASSGDHVRHRLSRAGNRQINRVLHIMAVAQLRHPAKGRAY
jgi:transposase